MTVTIVDEARAVTGGVDTHADTHMAAALDTIGGLLGVQEFPATPAGYAGLLTWLRGFGTVHLVGIEGTGSYGAGLARHITAAGVRVVEVDRADRQDRRRLGKSDPLDAVSAARAAQSGRARGAPKGPDGAVGAVPALMVAQRTARSVRIQTITQPRALVLTGPDDIRTRFAGHATGALVAELAALRPRPGSMIRYHTLLSLRELGRRAQFLDQQLDRPGRAHRAAGDRPRPRPARPVRRRPAHRRHAADRCRRSPRAAAVGGCLGAPVRRRADPRLLRHGQTPPAQPPWRPPGQPRPVADRDHPDELPPAHPRLRGTAHRRRPVQERNHPLPQALRRPRGLPSPAGPRRVTLKLPGAAWPHIRLPQP